MAGTTDAMDLSDANAILKYMYLPGFREAFNNSKILLNRLKRRKATMQGDRIVFAFHKSRNFGTGPRAETGTDVANPPYLPAPGHQGWAQGYLQSKYYYGRFKITGAALSRAKGSGALVDLLGMEMQGIKADVAKHVNRDVYRDGTAAWAKITTGADSTTQVVDTTQLLEPGMQLVAATSTGASGLAFKVSTVDSETQITIDPQRSTTTNDLLYPGGLYNTDVSSAYGNAIAGLKQIITNPTHFDVDYAGIDRSVAGNSFVDGSVISGAGGLSIDLMLETQQEMNKKAEGKLSLIVGHPIQWRAYGNLMAPDRRWVDKIRKLDGGFDSLEFNGVPFVPDWDCQKDTLWFLDEDTFEFAEEDPIDFIDEDGAVLCRVGSGTTAEDAFEATLVWRMNLLCRNPARNAKIHSLP